ncbi:Ldh family oxidoreductase [Rhodococcus koreensis]
MRIGINEAGRLVEEVMATFGYDAAQSRTIAEHLIDTELRGFTAGGLARAVTVAERLETSDAFHPISVINETPTSLAIDGGDQVGYVVAKHLTERLIEKARSGGGCVVGSAKNTWCTGMFSNYLEMITAAGMMGFAASSGSPFVTPAGGVEARFGTNPVAFGFPTSADPVIWDIGTSSMMINEVTYAEKQGETLSEGVGFDRNGQPTTDPADVLDGGSITTWGGHKGSGLALSAQLLGMMAGSSMAPASYSDMGFFMIVVDPDLLSSGFAMRASEFVGHVRATKPSDVDKPVRLPFERSIATRSALNAAGKFEVEDRFIDELRAIRDRRSGQ